jgi:hypothetical protein
MKIFILILFTISINSFAHASQKIKVKLTCHLSGYPDQGLHIQVIDVGSRPDFELLVAVITPDGNIKPHVIGAFPVERIPVNGTGVYGYSGKDFNLTISSQIKTITLVSGGDDPQSMTGDIAPNFYCR